MRRCFLHRIVSSLMIAEHSYGVIPMKNVDGHWQVLLIQNRSGGYWDFPKGHPIDGEEPQDTAKRELREETGFEVVSLIDTAPLIERYTFFHDGEEIDKTVTLFCAIVEGAVVIDAREIISCEWLLVSDAPDRITYPAGKAVAEKLISMFG